MLKKVGFLFLIVLVAVLLRPQLFFEKAATETLADFSNSSKLENISRGDNNTTDYAEGYNKADFGAAFESDDEDPFPLEESTPPVGPWADLLKLKFSIKFDQEVDDVIFKPQFTTKIKSYENKYSSDLRECVACVCMCVCAHVSLALSLKRFGISATLPQRHVGS